ncbi:MAG: glycosyltransferase [Deltaproteobacteria bacterium]|nr:glycosyltransferase [Deltaproteobacteria bacterium]
MEERYDIVVGIPSYSEAKTIRHVTQTAGEGLKTYYPDMRSVIVNCDNNSPDGTREAFLAAEIPEGIDRKYISTPEGVRGKGNNFWNLFHFCRDVQSKATIVVDADLRSIRPIWIKYLGGPILEGYDYVTPLYSRHQFDGTITNHLCYPLVFALAGYDVRQPIGGEFSFSPGLCSFWLEQEWDDRIRHYGIDIFMSLNAFFGGFRVCQTGLGNKVHNASSPKLGTMFEEVVHTLFTILLAHRSVWLNAWLTKGQKTDWQMDVKTVELFGLQKMKEAQALSIDIVDLKHKCRNEYETYKDLVKWYLSPYGFRRFHDMIEMDYYDIDIMLWSQIVYSLMYLFDGAKDSAKADIINALKPLYFARSITFDYVTRRYSVGFAELEVRNQAMAFLSQKPYLLGLYLGECMPYINTR